MKTHRLLLPLLMGVLVALGMLVMLSQVSQVAADEPQEWDGNWYWKDGGWADYAPSGVPDLDQKQGLGLWENPPGKWSYCGPVAAANSVWWFDSVFEPYPQPPPIVNDNYYLVTPYGTYDDHDPQNVGGMGPPGLVDHLACYFDTDGKVSGTSVKGTEVHTMSYGLQWYLYNDSTHPCYDATHRGYAGSWYDDYHVQLVQKPTWNWVVREVERSEDVILLLGIWQDT